MFIRYLAMLVSMMGFHTKRLARVEPEDNGGVGVSTVWTSDEGYETAILDANGVHPVERYEDEESALQGHERWVSDANKLTEVIVLGLSMTGSEPEVIKVEKVKESDK